MKVAMLELWFPWELKFVGNVLDGLWRVVQGQDTQTRFTETPRLAAKEHHKELESAGLG